MLTDLADACRKSGLKVIEVAGWKSRGYLNQSLQAVYGVLWHHTATASVRGMTSGAPTLNMLTNGRSDLAGPLCNLALGRGGEVYVVAAGVANHAGTGGFGRIPKNAGNHYLIGIEMESSGTAPWDWTKAQLAAAPKLGAALEAHYLSRYAPDDRYQLGHMEYSDAGKIDPAGWPGGMDGLRNQINAVLNGGTNKPDQGKTQEEDMTTDQSVQNIVRAELERYLGDINTADGPRSVRQFIADGTRAAQAARDNTTTIFRNGQNRLMRQEIADSLTNTITIIGRLAALEETIKQLSTKAGQPVDLDAVRQAAEEGSTKALASGVDINLTVGQKEVPVNG